MNILTYVVESIQQLDKQVNAGQKLTAPERAFLEYVVKECWGWVEAATTAKAVLEDNSKIAGREITMSEM